VDIVGRQKERLPIRVGQKIARHILRQSHFDFHTIGGGGIRKTSHRTNNSILLLSTSTIETGPNRAEPQASGLSGRETS